MSDNNFEEYVEVVPQNGRFYIKVKSNVIQRWAARQFKNDNYYTMTGSMWRKATKAKGVPEGAMSNSLFQTVYFMEQGLATASAGSFVAGLQEQNVV